MAGKKKSTKRGRSGSNSESSKSPTQSQSLKKSKQSHLFDNTETQSDNESIYLDADADGSDLESTVDEKEHNLEKGSAVSTFKMAANKIELVDALKEALKDPEVVELISSTLLTEIETLKTVITEKDSKIKELEDKIEGLEMYGRRNGVRIYGIPEKKGEDTDEIVISLANNIGADIPKFALGRSHRVGPKNSDKQRPIIAKFIGHNFKVNMLKNKSKLKDLENYDNVFINEDLTSRRAKMAQCARELRKKDKIQSTWTRDGIIFVKHKDKDKDTPGTVDRVECEADLEKIEKMYSLVMTIPKAAIY